MATKLSGKVIPFVRKEIVSLRATNKYIVYNDDRLTNPDRVLDLNGGRVDAELLGIYDKILRKDAHLYSLFQTRKHMVLGKPFEVLPASEEKRDIEIADFTKYQIYDHIENFTQDLYETLSALQYGFSVSEFMFDIKNNIIVIDKIRFRHPSHFDFNIDADLLWIKQDSTDPINLSKNYPGKFLIHRQGGNDENPYGESLISERLYWLYFFKNNLFKFLVNYVERFGSPIPTFAYPPGTSEDEHKVIDEMMCNFHDELAIKYPIGVELDFLEWKSSGNRAVHEAAIRLINSEMSKAILGQTLTSEVQDRGSKSQASVHLNILDNIIRFDCINLEATLNHQLIRRVVDLNFKNVTRYPFIKFKTEAGIDLKALAERDKTLIEMGVKIPQSYFHETYGVPVEEEPPPSLPQNGGGTPSPLMGEGRGEGENTREFAEAENKEDNLLIKQHNELDRYLDKAIERSIHAQEKFNNSVKKIIKLKNSFNELQKVKWEDEIYREDIEPLAEVLTDITFFAYYLGKSHIVDHINILEFAESNNDFTFIEAVNYFKKKLPVTMNELNENRDKLSDKAFYISRVNNKRLVEDIHKELTKAIEKGIPFNKWKKSVNELFDKKGLSRINPFHLETVFRTNVGSAYAMGRYEQISTPEMREAFPYWRYSAIMDRKVRPAHRSLHGLVLPNDHPRWSSIYPPSGFNCRCTVVVIDKDYFTRKGLPEPKKGEYSFIYHDKDRLAKVPIEKPQGAMAKGKDGWNVQKIKESQFIFPERDKGFKSTRKGITTIDPKIHGDDPDKFGLKNRLAERYKTKKIDGKELPAVNTNDEWKALIEEKSQGYDFERQIHKGIEIKLHKRRVRDYEFKDIQKFIKSIKKTHPEYLKDLKKITYIAETIETLEDGKPVFSNGWYDEAEKALYLFNRANYDQLRVLKHELGHHVFHELLEKEFGHKILARPRGREEIADIIAEILRDKKYGKKLLIDTFKLTPQEIEQIEKILQF